MQSKKMAIFSNVALCDGQFTSDHLLLFDSKD